MFNPFKKAQKPVITTKLQRPVVGEVETPDVVQAFVTSLVSQDKAIITENNDRGLYRKNAFQNERSITLPSWVTAYAFYELYSPVRASVDLIGNTIQGLGYDIVNKEGQPVEQVKELLEACIGNLDNFLLTGSKQLSLYNFIIDSLVDETKPRAHFRLLSASNVYGMKVLGHTGEITNFGYSDEVHNSRTYYKYQEGSDYPNFQVSASSANGT